MTTFDPITTTATLSNGNLTATTGASRANSRSTTSKTAGKWYVEVTLNVFNVANQTNASIGLCNASHTMGLEAGYTANSMGFEGGSPGIGAQCSLNSGSIGASTGFNWAAGNVICLALDIDNLRAWGRRNSSAWNNDGAADPATNTGGNNFSALSGPYFFIAGDGTASAEGDAFTVNFGASAFTQTKPSGFSAWDA